MMSSSKKVLFKLLDEHLDELERLLTSGKDVLEAHRVWYFIAETVRRARRWKKDAAAYVLERIKRMQPNSKMASAYADILHAAKSLLVEVSSRRRH